MSIDTTIAQPILNQQIEQAHQNRIIGRYIGEEKGPLFIVVGAMHGNEMAGVYAIWTLLDMLEKESAKNPDFIFCGQFIGIYGNVRAMTARKRFILRDLNRQWRPEYVAYLQTLPPETLEAEDAEIVELLDVLKYEVDKYEPEEVVFIDLHTTSADGGIFSVVTDELRSLQIAVQLHAPVITGMMQGLEGTTLHYFTEQLFGVPTAGLAFESGQHDDPDSIRRAISALVSCLRSVGCVHAFIIESKHDHLLIEYARKLPKVTELLYVHSIKPEDDFNMLSGFRNFLPIKEGQVLATDKHGLVKSPHSGLMLMPLYQAQGENGFFIVKEVYQGAF